VPKRTTEKGEANTLGQYAGQLELPLTIALAEKQLEPSPSLARAWLTLRAHSLFVQAFSKQDKGSVTANRGTCTPRQP
jgi:hypothetical protein